LATPAAAKASECPVRLELGAVRCFTEPLQVFDTASFRAEDPTHFPLLLAVEGTKHAKVLDLPIIGRIMKGAVWKGPSDDCTEKD
jgi:hypothetical protein